MQRGTSYGIDAAYADSLQPALLMVYRWTSDVWHRFLDGVQDKNKCVAGLSTSNGNDREGRPRKRQRTKHVATHLRTPASSEGGLQSTPISVGMSPPLDDSAIRQRFVRSTTPCLASSTELEALGDISGHRAAASTPTLSRPPSPLLNDFTKSPQRADDMRQAAGNATSTINDAPQVEYLLDFKLLVCKKHGYAIRNIRRLLADLHPESKAANKAAVRKFADIEIATPESVALPTSAIAPFVCLEAPVSAYLCTGVHGTCGYISACDKKLARHWRNVHGNSPKFNKREHCKKVMAQSFCPVKQTPRWFLVHDST